jgi:hypothetical protein
MTDERLVALRIEFDQLQSDRKALKKGEAGYLLSPDRLQTLDIRIATVRDELARIEPLNPDWRRRRETPRGRRQPD